MAAPEVDSVSGLSYEFLHALVFTVFPNSTKGFAHELEEDWLSDTGSIGIYEFTGSMKEHLDIPGVVNKNTGYIHRPDIDRMDILNVGRDINVIQDQDYPLHCYLHILPDNTLQNICTEQQQDSGFLLAGEAVQTFYKQQFIDNGIIFPENAAFHDVGIKVQANFQNQSGTLTEMFSEDHIPCLEIKCPQLVLLRLSVRGESARNTCLPELRGAVKDLHEGNIHVVYKPHVHSSNPDIQWRYSFSVTERKLALSLNETQRTAYQVLKALVLVKINDKLNEDQKLPSYLLKTALFWVCEELPVGFCIPKNSGKLFLALLDKLVYFLDNNYFPHFFIPEGNLVDKYDSAEVKIWLKALHKTRLEPVKAIVDFWNTYELEINQNERFTENFVNCIQFHNADRLWNLVLDTYLGEKDFVNFMRLYTVRTPVFCFCKKRWILENSQECQKCLIAKFCDLTDDRDLDPSVLPHLALMWFIRSVHTQNNEYEYKAIELFKKARTLYDVPQHKYYKYVIMQYSIHYALFLMARNYYEKAVSTVFDLLTSCIEELVNSHMYLSCFLRDMLDEVLKAKLGGKPYLFYPVSDLAYHILISSYIQAGVYTELILPSNVIDKCLTDYFWKNMVLTKGGKFYRQYLNRIFHFSAQQIGDEFFLRKDYYKAAQWYVTPESGLPDINMRFIVCIAKLFNAERFQDSVNHYLKPQQEKELNR